MCERGMKSPYTIGDSDPCTSRCSLLVKYFSLFKSPNILRQNFKLVQIESICVDDLTHYQMTKFETGPVETNGRRHFKVHLKWKISTI